MSVRAKFVVSEVAATMWGQTKVTLSPQYDSSIPEDQAFSKSTPTGLITLTIDNPAAAQQLALKKAFYVDFTEVAESAPSE